MKSVNVEIEIDSRSNIQDKAFDLAVDWKSGLLDSYPSTNWDLGSMTRSFYVVSLIVKATFLGIEISTF